MDFETGVIKYLETAKTGELHPMSDFYEECCNLLGISHNDIYPSREKVRRKLLAMKKKGLIESRRVGTGFLGKTDSGCTNMNCYTLPGFWK